MKKARFNIIDAIILIAFLLVAAFAAGKVFGGKGNESGEQYTISVYCEEVPLFAAELIKKGDIVSDEGKNITIGKAEEVILGDAAVYTANEEGKLIKSPKEGYAGVTVKIFAEGESFEHGVKIEGNRYSVGHSVVLYAGKAKISGRVSDIEKK